MFHYTLADEVSQGVDMYPRSFNTPSETLSSWRELESSIPKPLVNSDKVDEDGAVENNASSLHTNEDVKKTHK